MKRGVLRNPCLTPLATVLNNSLTVRYSTYHDGVQPVLRGSKQTKQTREALGGERKEMTRTVVRPAPE